jgi:ribosomal protein L40E
MATEKCYRCGSVQLEAGIVQTVQKLGLLFVPNDRTFWTLSPGIDLDAYICMVCGAVALFGDPRKAEELLAHGERSDKNA